MLVSGNILFAQVVFMAGSSQAGLAEKYLVDDLPGAVLVGARLNGILQKIEAGETLTSLAEAFLASAGLSSLLAVNRHAILTPYRHAILTPLGAAEIGARADGTDHGVQAGRASIGVRRGF